jgi:hypothetical protein
MKVPSREPDDAIALASGLSPHAGGIYLSGCEGNSPRSGERLTQPGEHEDALGLQV